MTAATLIVVNDRYVDSVYPDAVEEVIGAGNGMEYNGHIVVRVIVLPPAVTVTVCGEVLLNVRLDGDTVRSPLPLMVMVTSAVGALSNWIV